MISSHDIESNNIKWYNVDNFELNDKEAVIINTDITGAPGIHWITLYKNGNKCYIIDSLGKNNFRPYDDILYDKLEKMKLKPFYYYGKFQYDTSNMCGWFAIVVAKYLNQLKPANPFNVVNDLFGKTADNSDIAQLIKHFGVDE